MLRTTKTATVSTRRSTRRRMAHCFGKGQAPGTVLSAPARGWPWTTGETLLPVSVEKVAASFRLRFPGVAGHSYQVLRASAPIGVWGTNATLTAVTNGIIEYIDPSPLPGSSFYRTAAAP